MRCRNLRKGLEQLGDAGLPVDVRQHLAGCPSCREHAARTERLRTGFRALAEETPPDVPIGFAARVVRRLEEAGEPAWELMERAGRRVVYASLVLAITLLLGLVLPRWGALSGAAGMDFAPTPQLQAAETDMVFSDEVTFPATRGSSKDLPGEGARTNLK